MNINKALWAPKFLKLYGEVFAEKLTGNALLVLFIKFDKNTKEALYTFAISRRHNDITPHGHVLHKYVKEVLAQFTSSQIMQNNWLDFERGFGIVWNDIKDRLEFWTREEWNRS